MSKKVAVWVAAGLVLGIVALPEAASALEAGVTARIGTLGFGGDVAIGLSDYLNVRGGLNRFSYTEEAEAGAADETVDLDMTLDLDSTVLLADLFMGKSEFRLTGGIVFNGNEFRVEADPQDLVEIGDGTYRVTQAEGRVTFDDVCPYFGLGYGNPCGEGHFHFSFDIGVMLHGEPQVEFSATAQNPALQRLLDADIRREINDIEDDISSFTFYPVLSFGLSYAF